MCWFNYFLCFGLLMVVVSILVCVKGCILLMAMEMVFFIFVSGAIKVVVIFGVLEMCLEGEVKDWCSADRLLEVFLLVSIELVVFELDAYEVMNFQYQYCEVLGKCMMSKGSNVVNL